MFHPE